MASPDGRDGLSAVDEASLDLAGEGDADAEVLVFDLGGWGRDPSI